MSQSGFVERRKHRRAGIHLEAFLEGPTPQESVRLTVVNFSAGGFFCRINREFEPLTSFQVTFQFPPFAEHPPRMIETSAVVVRCEKAAEDAEDWRMAACFVMVPEEDKAHILGSVFCNHLLSYPAVGYPRSSRGASSAGGRRAARPRGGARGRWAVIPSGFDRGNQQAVRSVLKPGPGPVGGLDSGGRPMRMLSRRVLATLFFWMALLPSISFAGDKYAAEFLRLGVGARALGMGGAFVALADDASASYWNPAGAARIERPEMLFMHAEQFGSIANHDYLAFVQPLEGGSARSAVGLGLIRFAVDDILVTRDAYLDLNDNGVYDRDQNGDGVLDDPEPILVDRFYTDSDTEYALLLTYGREMSERFSLGGNIKLLRQGLLDNTSFGVGLDLGLLASPRPDLKVGVRVADATTTRISWDTGRREVVNPSLTFGAAWTRRLPGSLGLLTGALGVAGTFEGREEASQASLGSFGGDLQGGVEYWYAGAVAGRLGLDAGNLTAGAGLRYRGLGADYAYLSHEELDATHRVSASFGF